MSENNFTIEKNKEFDIAFDFFIRRKKTHETQWLKSARKAFKPKKKKCCFVCNKHIDIVEAHHVYPLSMQAKQIQGNLSIDPDNTYVWLCPNHHKYIHLACSKYSSKNISKYKELPSDEIAGINKILEEYRKCCQS